MGVLLDRSRGLAGQVLHSKTQERWCGREGSRDSWLYLDVVFKHARGGRGRPMLKS